MSKSGRVVLLATAVAIPITISDLAHPAIDIGLLLGLATLGTRLVPGFWRTVAHGGVGGALAGLLILGVGWRLAMRVVAMMEPLRTPGFTIEGTMFILIGVGLVLGGIVGVVSNLIRHGIGLGGPWRAGSVPAVLMMAVLLLSPEQRSEIFRLGGGPILNLPMFGVIAYLYGVAAMRWAHRLERRRPTTATADRTDSAASMDLAMEKRPRG